MLSLHFRKISLHFPEMQGETSSHSAAFTTTQFCANRDFPRFAITVWLPVRVLPAPPRSPALTPNSPFPRNTRDVLERQQVAAQVSASGINAVLVAPQLAVDAAEFQRREILGARSIQAICRGGGWAAGQASRSKPLLACRSCFSKWLLAGPKGARANACWTSSLGRLSCCGLLQNIAMPTGERFPASKR